MKVFTLEGIDMIHISEFADVLRRSVPATRRLIEQGNSIRKLKAYRDRSRLMIPVTEITGYPFVNAGRDSSGTLVFHYALNKETGKYERYLCKECSFSDNKCLVRKQADELKCPEGDI